MKFIIVTITSIVLSEEDDWIICLMSNMTIQIYGIAEKALQWQTKEPVEGTVFGPGLVFEDRLYTCTDANQIKTWKIEGLKCLSTIENAHPCN
jgi:hypothetical protein